MKRNTIRNAREWLRNGGCSRNTASEWAPSHAKYAEHCNEKLKTEAFAALKWLEELQPVLVRNGYRLSAKYNQQLVEKLEEALDVKTTSSE
jgi:hypothetical protein